MPKTSWVPAPSEIWNRGSDLAVGREQEEHPAVEGRFRERRRKGYGELDRGGGEDGRREQDSQRGSRQRGEERTGTVDVHGPSCDFIVLSGKEHSIRGPGLSPRLAARFSQSGACPPDKTIDSPPAGRSRPWWAGRLPPRGSPSGVIDGEGG
ncbi:MAG: hypothetical protein MZV64_10995 [Ignavibacteriales bacterium]|nr:hypothetical protein [Ignavibacteriales bacterium]